ncbi:MAG: hypothetical protein R3B06_12280 [Kofleriaceae bacterium]
MRVSQLCLPLLLVAGCATAAGTGVGDDDPIDARSDGGSSTDAPQVVDAPLPTDAPPPVDAPAVQTVTLSQSSSMAITALHTVACSNQTTGFTAENSYYRAFRLADFGVTNAFTATRVDVGIEQATGVGGSQSMQVKVYTVAGTFPAGVLTQIAGQLVTVPDSATNTVMQIPLAPAGLAPAGSTVVVEAFIPDGRAIGNVLYLGSNAAAESGPTYLRAPDCGSTQPQPISALVSPDPQVHVVLTVTGTH